MMGWINILRSYCQDISLFHKVKKNIDSNILSCKMHDLAQSVLESEILISRDGMKYIIKRVHHVSLFGPLSFVMKGLEVKSIRTLFMFYIDDSNIVNPLIPNCKTLHALKLKMLKFEKVLVESLSKNESFEVS